MTAHSTIGPHKIPRRPARQAFSVALRSEAADDLVTLCCISSWLAVFANFERDRWFALFEAVEEELMLRRVPISTELFYEKQHEAAGYVAGIERSLGVVIDRKRLVEFSQWN